ncbi:MAG TPA: TrkA family potassium uptake protein [Candidatus Eremiobacteraceae bacterium]|nr:TrkA family potassium uptake protein [Candidatus Eremiobacteraceae bacterium]
MRYLIVGCGRVGSTLAKRLTRSGHQVTVVDENPASFVRLGRNFTGQQVLGTGIDVDVLERAGAKSADGFAAVTQGDNRNIMAALIALQHFKIKRVVARIYDPERAHMYRDFGIYTICPTTVGAKLIADVLVAEDYRVLPFERKDIDVIEFVVDAKMAGKTVGDVTRAGMTQVCVVVRREQSTVPQPDMRLETGDRVVVVIKPDFLEEFRKSIAGVLAKVG